MGKAIAVDGSGSPPSTQIIFSAIGEQKEGHYTSRGRSRLTGRCGRAPWRAPSPSTQTFKNLSNIFWFKATTPPLLTPPSSIQFSSDPFKNLPEHCLRLKKIGTIFFLNKEVSKAEPAPCRKPPQGALTQAKKKKEREKGKRKVILTKSILQIKSVSLVVKWGILSAVSC